MFPYKDYYGTDIITLPTQYPPLLPQCDADIPTKQGNAETVYGKNKGLAV
jgi:hypothetical protein